MHSPEQQVFPSPALQGSSSAMQRFSKRAGGASVAGAAMLIVDIAVMMIAVSRVVNFMFDS